MTKPTTAFLCLPTAFLALSAAPTARPADATPPDRDQEIALALEAPPRRCAPRRTSTFTTRTGTRRRGTRRTGSFAWSTTGFPAPSSRSA